MTENPITQRLQISHIKDLTLHVLPALLFSSGFEDINDSWGEIGSLDTCEGVLGLDELGDDAGAASVVENIGGGSDGGRKHGGNNLLDDVEGCV